MTISIDYTQPLVCPLCGTDRGQWVPGALRDGRGACFRCVEKMQCKGCGVPLSVAKTFVDERCPMCREAVR